jgi:hypothetical protein
MVLLLFRIKMGVTTERRRKYSPTYLQGITMPERPHTLEEYATDHFRSRYAKLQITTYQGMSSY